jgi:hypothetical protein
MFPLSARYYPASGKPGFTSRRWPVHAQFVALPRVPFYHQLSNRAGSGKGLFTIDIVILKICINNYRFLINQLCDLDIPSAA